MPYDGVELTMDVHILEFIHSRFKASIAKLLTSMASVYVNDTAVVISNDRRKGNLNKFLQEEIGIKEFPLKVSLGIEVTNNQL